ncbi:hypothetical protein LTR48_001814 [Friedmanniomyces endolithicus]|uniref:Uncharacterized protein n=2 Tax=Dothideomycetidae TaxID=451867 RepID=A0A4U0VK21_9PEZI|nr:hypothetical protein LTS09_002728 [Friedmanniomyces endolithicus]KAK5146922.1 hypothetical protein LTR32_001569 [Rachicladosporium monterosium]KAK0933503.1 hypothetical protein LTR29_014908 [Friedmanniomyces endolithicus]KAK1093697.1 hypothetical protein LTR48_001814 [Friedmanniomyces endolithicus]KAK1821141.1 hypothetical protein LTR12_004365 [Friedmanniomyces endolithicus]
MENISTPVVVIGGIVTAIGVIVNVASAGTQMFYNINAGRVAWRDLRNLARLDGVISELRAHKEHSEGKMEGMALKMVAMEAKLERSLTKTAALERELSRVVSDAPPSRAELDSMIAAAVEAKVSRVTREIPAEGQCRCASAATMVSAGTNTRAAETAVHPSPQGVEAGNPDSPERMRANSAPARPHETPVHPSTQGVETDDLDRPEGVERHSAPTSPTETTMGARTQAPSIERPVRPSTQAVEAGDLDGPEGGEQHAAPPPQTETTANPLTRVDGAGGPVPEQVEGHSASDRFRPVRNPGSSSSRRGKPVSSKSQGKKPWTQY